MKMKMDFSKFKKISEDLHTATLQHPHGHKITIAKNQLSPEMKGNLANIPMHFDDGGQVPEETETQQPQANQPVINIINHPSGQPEVSRSPASMVPEGQGQGLQQAQPSQPIGPQNAPLPGAGMQKPAVPQPQDPYGVGVESQMVKEGLSQQQSGIRGQAKEIGKLGAAEAPIYGSAATSLQEAENSNNKRMGSLWDDHMALQKDIYDNKIKESDWWDSKSTGGQIASTIGLLLGGLGAGLTGGRNQALDTMNGLIDRNIMSQKANLGRKENLLSANLRLMGNLNDAMQLTRANLQGIAANKIDQAVSQHKGPIAGQSATLASGQLKASSGSIIGGLEAKSNILGSMQQGGGITDPKQASVSIPYLFQDKSQQNEAYKELTATQNMIKSKEDVLNAYRQMEDIQTLGNRALNPVQSSSQIDKIINPLLLKIVHDSAGRVNMQEVQMIKKNFPGWMDNEETRQIGYNQLASFMDSKIKSSLLEGHGIRLQSPTPPRVNKQFMPGYQPQSSFMGK